MKVEIKPSGVLVVKSESELEAYALRMWGEVNEGLIPSSILIKPEFTVDCSDLSFQEIQDEINE